jgi:phosphoglycolate phosphatase-like HAD superfamily hydrolase
MERLSRREDGRYEYQTRKGQVLEFTAQGLVKRLEDFPDFGSFDKLVIVPGRVAFGVVATLAELKRRGVKVAALTDAPRNPAEQRARLMKLDEHIDALYTLPGFDFPADATGAALVSEAILTGTSASPREGRSGSVDLPPAGPSHRVAEAAALS